MTVKLENKIALNHALCQMNDEGLLPQVPETWYSKLDGVRSSLKSIENWDERVCKKLTYADLFSEKVIADISQKFSEIKEDTLVFRKIEETGTSQKGQHEQYIFHQVLFEKLKAQIIEDSIDELLFHGGYFDSPIHSKYLYGLKIPAKVLIIKKAITESSFFLNELIHELKRFNIIVNRFKYDEIDIRFEINLDMLKRYKIEKFCLNHLQ